MRKAALVLLAATAAVLLAVVLRGPSPQAGTASSHREAPLISDDPTADNTDLYAFRSPDKPNMLTIISNVIPGEDPAAGPNYFTFSPTARYNIYIDRNGDGKQDITYRFKFNRKPGVAFLGNTVQSYTVTKIARGKSQVVARASTPPNNIGPRTLKTLYKTTDYRSLAAKAVTSMKGGGLVFAGQRDDPFFGDIGAIFDFVAIRRGTGNAGGGKDFLADYAVHAMAIQIPIAQVDTKSHAIGIWTSVDRRNVTVGGRVNRGWTQVSRLGNPLVNEVIIPTGLKDLWNRVTPAQEKQFAKYYRTPILAGVINQLYKLGVPTRNRDDLVAVLLTGIPKVTFTGKTLADELRINLSVPVTEASKFSRLGVLGGDNQGWPNGRRLGDDVIDIAEQAVGGFLKGKKLPLGDGVNFNDVQRLNTFPYVADPPDGFANAKGAQKP
jgi:hypothetical protein